MPHRLSVKQGACLNLVAQGYTSKEIGKMIGVSRYTVDAHLERAMRTLGTTSRQQSARAYLEYQKRLNMPQSIGKEGDQPVRRNSTLMQQVASSVAALWAASTRLVH